MILKKYLIASLFFAFISCSTTHSNGKMTFTTLEYTEFGNYQEKEKRLIQDVDTFRDVYTKVYENHSPIPEIPKVNFKKNDVIFIHFGEFRHGGIKMSVDSIFWDKKDLVISINKKSPKAGEPVSSVMTYPFLFVEIDKLSKKPNDIKLTF